MATLRIRPDIVYREVDGVIVAFALESGEYVSLDDIGTDIWRLSSVMCGWGVEQHSTCPAP